MTVARSLAPVGNPAPPKPPQLNIVASSLMPDVDTTTKGPGTYTLTAAGTWTSIVTPTLGRRTWTKDPGDVSYRSWAEEHNALVAAIGTMSDVEMKQAEQSAGVNPTSMPVSIFPATDSSTRWTGGFAYAPENQYKATLIDPCAAKPDRPALTPPVITAGTPSTASGTLAAATYHYKVSAVNANGETLPSSVRTVVLGGTGHITLTWTQGGRPNVTHWVIYRTVSGTYDKLATVTGLSYVDTGAATPTGSHHPATANTTGGVGHYGNLAQVKYVPFIIMVEDSCSAFGFEKRDFVGRALRLLDNATPNAIETELWSGAFSRNTYTGPFAGMNAFFTQPGGSTDATGGTALVPVDLTPGSGSTPPSITRGIQILEDYLANSGFGGQGMLHVAPETSPNLLGARRLGPLLLSVMDNIIVPGSGYPTTGHTGPIGNSHATPTAGYQWIFATDLISVRLDEPTVFPTTMAEAFTRSTGGTPNTIRFRAERFAAATWDGARLACCRVALSS